MHILNSENYERHMDPRNNYLVNLIDEKIDSNEGIVVEETREVPFAESTLVVEEKASLGRNGSSNIPNFMKATVAAVANSGLTTQKEVAQAFGISKSLTSEVARGLDGHKKPNQELQSVGTDVRTSIINAALAKTMASLDLLTEDDISCLGAKDKADVAVKMSKVADNLTARNKDEGNKNLIIIHASQVRNEVHYDVVEV